MISLNQLYQTEPLRHNVEVRTALSDTARMLEVSQPEGDFSTPPARELTLIEPLSPGIHLTKRWGLSKFHGVAPVNSNWLVPPDCEVNLQIHTPHVIRILLLDPSHLADVVGDAGSTGDFASLHNGPLFNTQLRQLMATLWGATASSMRTDGLWVDAIIDQLITQLMTAAGTVPRPVRGGLNPRQVRVLREMFTARQDTTLRIDALARQVGFSPYHFARAFKITFGVPPHRYQKLERLYRARGLLAKTNLSVLEVALSVGYSTAESLSRLFRAELRMSPQQYRRVALL